MICVSFARTLQLSTDTSRLVSANDVAVFVLWPLESVHYVTMPIRNVTYGTVPYRTAHLPKWMVRLHESWLEASFLYETRRERRRSHNAFLLGASRRSLYPCSLIRIHSAALKDFRFSLGQPNKDCSFRSNFPVKVGGGGREEVSYLHLSLLFR